MRQESTIRDGGPWPLRVQATPRDRHANLGADSDHDRGRCKASRPIRKRGQLQADRGAGRSQSKGVRKSETGDRMLPAQARTTVKVVGASPYNPLRRADIRRLASNRGEPLRLRLPPFRTAGLTSLSATPTFVGCYQTGLPPCAFRLPVELRSMFRHSLHSALRAGVISQEVGLVRKIRKNRRRLRDRERQTW